MGVKKDLTGQVFGRLTVIQEASHNSTNGIMWLCQCTCGNQKAVRTYDLARITRSCGCLHKEAASKRRLKHGMSRSKVYATWANIIHRCYNPNCKDFHHYGGRGIAMNQKWRDSFDAFLQDVGEPPTSKHTLDRIDFNGDYEPSNCRWITQKEQTRNTRRSRMLTWNGKTQCLSAWAEELAIPKYYFYDRFKRGWSEAEIFTSLGL